MSRTPDDYLSEVLRLEQPLRAILHRFAPEPADLDDLLQETYSRLFSLTPDRRAHIRSIQAFAITTARNVATDWVRRQRIVNMQTMDDFADLPSNDDTVELEEIVHTHQQLLRIAAGIAQLPETCREVFTLRRVYGLSQKEIAAKLGITEGAVEQHLIRGMKRCTEILENHAAPQTRKAAIQRRSFFGRLRKRATTRGKQG